MLKKNQAGFTAIAAILLVIIVAGIGFTGWYVWHAKQNTDKTLNNASNSANSTVPKTTGTTTSTPSTMYPNYFDIAEWHIRMAFSDADKVTYSMSSNGDTASLYLKDSVTSLETCKTLGLGIFRSTNRADGTSNTKTKVGNYYYSITGGPGACLEPGDPNYAVEQLRIRIITDELGANKYTLTTIN
jgi:hypothetical protein